MPTPNVLTTANVTELVALMGGTTPAGEFIRTLKRMEQGAALKVIEDTIPEASYDLKSGLIKLIPENVFEVNIPKGKQYAILWLCGATYGQLALIYGIAKETAHSSANRYLTPEIRAEVKPYRSKFTTNITPTQFVAYREILMQWASNSDRFKLLTQGSVARIASAIMQEYNENQQMYVEVSQSAYNTLGEIKSRIEGQVELITDKTSYSKPTEELKFKKPALPELALSHNVTEPKEDTTKVDQMSAFDKMFGKK